MALASRRGACAALSAEPEIRRRLVLNGELVQQRRRELGLSRRALAQRLSVSQTAVRTIETRREHPTANLHLVERLAAELAVNPRNLLLAVDVASNVRTREPLFAEPAEGRDHERLGAVLGPAGGTHRDDLAQMLDWSLERMVCATAALAERLRQVGWLLCDSADGTLRVAPDETLLSADELNVVDKARLGREGINALEARTLWRLLFAPPDGDPFDQRLSNPERVAIGRLLRLGLVVRGDEDIEVAAAVRRNLAIPEPEPDPDFVPDPFDWIVQVRLETAEYERTDPTSARS
jgi:transcriptional regulator with XRE-family HTH domain